MTMARRASSTWIWHCCGKNLPTLAAPSAGNLRGTPRSSSSGHIFEAPKLEKSHHLRPGLALIAERAHGQPTPAIASARTRRAMKERRMRDGKVHHRAAGHVHARRATTKPRPVTL